MERALAGLVPATSSAPWSSRGSTLSLTSRSRGASATSRTRAAIGAYIGVPLYLADGTLYGSLCCLSHQPDHSLDQRDVDFMAMLANDLEEQRAHDRERQRVIDVIGRSRFSKAGPSWTCSI